MRLCRIQGILQEVNESLNPELITDEHTGYLFPPRDIAALARVILRMMEDPEKAKAMARMGAKRVEAEFSVTAKIDRTEALYRRLLAAKRPR